MEFSTRIESTQGRKLYRIFKTVTKMLEDRGYFVSKEQREMTFDGFESYYQTKESIMIVAPREDDDQKNVVVYFSDEDKFGKDQLANIVKKLARESDRRNIALRHAIVILKFDCKYDTTLPDYNIETFNEDDLVVNITEHELVPKHQIISQAEKEELLKRYRVKESQLPKMLLKDPITRYFGLTRGQVVKITRESETAGKYITYRVVSG